MSHTPKATLIGFRTLEEAQQCIKSLTDDYVITVITEGAFNGDVLAYAVIHKDVDPIHARGSHES
jgi:hypothetical protein